MGAQRVTDVELFSSDGYLHRSGRPIRAPRNIAPLLGPPAEGGDHMEGACQSQGQPAAEQGVINSM